MRAHNRGRYKSPLGHSHSTVERVCETCGKKFPRRVKNVTSGGARFCSKPCNPVYAPRFTRSEIYRRCNLKRGYGLTPDAYQELLDRQGGVCAICGEPAVATSQRHKNLSVDHDHVDGRVRGLLCNGCNRGIGWLRDDPALLARAILYLRAAANKRWGLELGPKDENEADARWIAATAAKG